MIRLVMGGFRRSQNSTKDLELKTSFKLVIYRIIIIMFYFNCCDRRLLCIGFLEMSRPLGPVMIQGLESKPQFNGCYGSIVGNQGERILVALDNGEVHSESMVPFSMNLVNAMPLATSMHSCGILVDVLIFSIFFTRPLLSRNTT
jgi:hypothetical protein